MGLVVRMVHQVLVEQMGHQVRTELRELVEQMEHQGHQVQMVLQVLVEQTELQELAE